MGGREEEDYPDEVEERLINEEYKIWKKNTPFLYGAERQLEYAIRTSTNQLWSCPNLMAFSQTW